MDRRSFFRKILYAPLLAPFILNTSSRQKGFQFYLIADYPQVFLPTLLQELQKNGMIHRHNFTLLNRHPEDKELKRVLGEEGWHLIPKSFQAELVLSFSHLLSQALPSFTLTREGKVWDVRSRKLYPLWKEMNSHNLSSCLTIGSYNTRRIDPYQATYAYIYIEGQKVEKISLDKNIYRKFQTERGSVDIVIEDGKARVSASSCRHKICLFTPPVSLAGERIICAPNHFLLEIRGSHHINTAIG